MFLYSEPAWYAVMVKPRFEKSVSNLLRLKEYEEFLPLISSTRNWSDRVKTVELPLFPRYLFCRFLLNNQAHILNTPGVQKIVGFGRKPTPVSDQEIASLRHLIESGVPPQECDYVADGQMVEVRDGPLAGIQGLLVKTKANCRVVVSIHLLQRSVYAELDRAAVTPLSRDQLNVA